MAIETTALLVGAGIRLLDMAIDFFRYNNLTKDEVDALLLKQWEKGALRDPANLPKPEA